MLKNKRIRRLALFASLIMLLTSTVNTTFGFIVTKTDSIINTFTPFESILSDLLISKTVEHPFDSGYVIPDNISFDFKVDFGSLYANTTIKTTAGNIIADNNGSINVSLKPGTSLGVEDIDAGTKVTVTEVQNSDSGFAVKDGAVTKEAIVTEDGNVKIEFINVYTPASMKPVNVTVGGTKILEGREWQDGDTFSFTLEQNTEGDTWVLLGTKTITYDAENAAFNTFDFSDLMQNLTFDKVGTYTFRMSEVVGNLENVDYDKTVNKFAVEVTDIDMDGKLEVGDVTGTQNAVVTKDNGKFNVSVTFNNTFVPNPEDIAVTITVNKTVKNTSKETLSPEGFEFVLENVATSERLALDSDESGKAIFTLPFTVADIGKTYTYKLFETNEGMEGMTYDTDIYDITVAIKLGEDNKLNATVTMNGSVVETAVAEFENIYHVEDLVPPTGDNSNNVFWFIMLILSGIACVVLFLLDKKYHAIETQI